MCNTYILNGYFLRCKTRNSLNKFVFLDSLRVKLQYVFLRMTAVRHNENSLNLFFGFFDDNNLNLVIFG